MLPVSREIPDEWGVMAICPGVLRSSLHGIGVIGVKRSSALATHATGREAGGRAGRGGGGRAGRGGGGRAGRGAARRCWPFIWVWVNLDIYGSEFPIVRPRRPWNLTDDW